MISDPPLHMAERSVAESALVVSGRVQHVSEMHISSFQHSLRISSVLLIGLGLGAIGCDDPASDKPRAEVSAQVAAKATPEAEPSAPAVHYAFSAAGSKVEFVGAKVTGSHDGSFGSFTGTVDVVEARPEKSSVTVEIDTASLESDNPKLTTHLKSPDFFDVEKFPKARFRSTSVRAGGANGATHTITGNLELHGVTKAISFPATIEVEPEVVSVNAEFSINRKDFGIVYPGMPDDLIRDDVLVRLNVAANKAP